MIKKFLYIFIVIVVLVTGVFIGIVVNTNKKATFLPAILEKDTYPDLSDYTIENLSKRGGIASNIKIVREIDENDDFTSYLISYTTLPAQAGDNKKVTGSLNVPNSGSKFPVIVMIRGYVDQTIYTTGVGTRHAAEEFVKAGFLTIAPDFLGYGESDENSGNIFESRFQTYTAVLDLLSSLDSLNEWDGKNVFIWGHSNGGHIALAILEITGKNYPTSLWAPVSAPFPYSILYYTNESEDGGKLIRGELAKFESHYDTDLYSITNYFDKITAEIQLHQGAADDAVPKAWSDSLSTTLNKLDLKVNYFIYPGADHNMTPGWDEAIARDIDFFASHKQY